MMKEILLVEDNHNFGMMLQGYLSLHAYTVDWQKNGADAARVLANKDFDLCILDVMMPDMDGFTLAEEMKRMGKQMPFFFLTAKGLKEDQLRGYKLGAFDYLIKPFDPEILILKIQALFHQITGDSGRAESIELGSFQLNISERTLCLGDSKQKLSPKEVELLCLLNEKRNKLLSRQEALLKIWKDDGYFPAQSMNVFITKLRKYLSKDPVYVLEIENIRNSGFVLRVQEKSRPNTLYDF